jgi:hypothetical protein
MPPIITAILIPDTGSQKEIVRNNGSTNQADNQQVGIARNAGNEGMRQHLPERNAGLPGHAQKCKAHQSYHQTQKICQPPVIPEP